MTFILRCRSTSSFPTTSVLYYFHSADIYAHRHQAYGPIRQRRRRPISFSLASQRLLRRPSALQKILIRDPHDLEHAISLRHILGPLYMSSQVHPKLLTARFIQRIYKSCFLTSTISRIDAPSTNEMELLCDAINYVCGR